jgi:hypothetical protein
VAPKIGLALPLAQPTLKCSAYPFQHIMSAQTTSSKQGTGEKRIGGNAFLTRFLILFCKEEIMGRDKDPVISDFKLQIADFSNSL